MPLKTIKTDTAEALTLEWVLHVKNYKLAIDKNLCQGCQICTLACPKEAIKLEKQPKAMGEKAKKAKIDVNLAKCNFCGICDILCPYGAIKMTLNGERHLSVVEKESFPQLVRDIQVDSAKHSPASDIKEICPLDLINVTWSTVDGKMVENPATLTEAEKRELRPEIVIKKEYCPCCRVCEFKLPEGTVRVRKFIQGKITIYPEKCPKDCTDCLDVCPITGTLYVSDADKKVHVNETFCVYCGACKAVCPVPEALELKRTKISHTPVHSGAWNKALEKLTSPLEMTKELKTKGSRKVRESVAKRLDYMVR
jgi:4Fe-4S ferredoxin